MKILIRQQILAERQYAPAVHSDAKIRNIVNNMEQIKSSNIWGYGIDTDGKSGRGNVIVRFRNKKTGGPGQVYVYYNVPLNIYRGWHSAASKGHYLWQHFRDKYVTERILDYDT